MGLFSSHPFQGLLLFANITDTRQLTCTLQWALLMTKASSIWPVCSILIWLPTSTQPYKNIQLYLCDFALMICFSFDFICDLICQSEDVMSMQCQCSSVPVLHLWNLPPERSLSMACTAGYDQNPIQPKSWESNNELWLPLLPLNQHWSFYKITESYRCLQLSHWAFLMIDKWNSCQP